MVDQETVEIKKDNLSIKRHDKSDSNEILKENILYMPEATNEKAIDAFFKLNGCLYILQFTIAEDHPLKGVVSSFTSYTDVPPSQQWKFVFITDGPNTLKVPFGKGYPFTLYSAIMEPRK